MKTQISQPRLGFTLIELLVVIGVIAVLSSILIPVLGEAKSKARAIKCISNKKQLVNAWHLYSTDNDGWLILNGETNVSVERIPAGVVLADAFHDHHRHTPSVPVYPPVFSASYSRPLRIIVKKELITRNSSTTTHYISEPHVPRK